MTLTQIDLTTPTPVQIVRLEPSLRAIIDCPNCLFEADGLCKWHEHLEKLLLAGYLDTQLA